MLGCPRGHSRLTTCMLDSHATRWIHTEPAAVHPSIISPFLSSAPRSPDVPGLGGRISNHSPPWSRDPLSFSPRLGSDRSRAKPIPSLTGDEQHRVVGVHSGAVRDQRTARHDTPQLGERPPGRIIDRYDCTTRCSSFVGCAAREGKDGREVERDGTFLVEVVAGTRGAEVIQLGC